MSYTRLDAPIAGPRETLMLQLDRVSRVVLWGAIHAILMFAEHAAELAAPFLILGGAVWWAVPQVLSAITLDGQANDILQMVRTRVPREVLLGGSWVSAGSLVTDGVLCIAVVAICRTVSQGLTTLMLDRR